MFFKNEDSTKSMHKAIRKNSLYTHGEILDDTRQKILDAISQGADVSQYVADEEFGNTPLLWAAGYGDEKLIQLILEKAPQTINFYNTMRLFGQNTPLTLAIKRAKFNAALQLVDGGADPNLPCTNSDGKTSLLTPLQLAVLCLGVVKENGVVIDLVKKLIEKGADIDQKNDLGYSARDYLTEFRVNWEDLHMFDVTNVKERNETYPPEKVEKLKKEFIEKYISSLSEEEKENIYMKGAYEGSGLENMKKEQATQILLRETAKTLFDEEYNPKLKSLEKQEEDISVQEFLNRNKEYASLNDFLSQRQWGLLSAKEYDYSIKKSINNPNVGLIEYTFQDHPISVFDQTNKRNNYLESDAGKKAINDIISFADQLKNLKQKKPELHVTKGPTK